MENEPVQNFHVFLSSLKKYCSKLAETKTTFGSKPIYFKKADELNKYVISLSAAFDAAISDINHLYEIEKLHQNIDPYLVESIIKKVKEIIEIGRTTIGDKTTDYKMETGVFLACCNKYKLKLIRDVETELGKMGKKFLSVYIDILNKNLYKNPNEPINPYAPVEEPVPDIIHDFVKQMMIVQIIIHFYISKPANSEVIPEEINVQTLQQSSMEYIMYYNIYNSSSKTRIENKNWLTHKLKQLGELNTLLTPLNNLSTTIQEITSQINEANKKNIIKTSIPKEINSISTLLETAQKNNCLLRFNDYVNTTTQTIIRHLGLYETIADRIDLFLVVQRGGKRHKYRKNTKTRSSKKKIQKRNRYSRRR